MTDEWQIGKDLKGRDRGPLEKLRRNLSGGKATNNLSEKNHCSGQDSKREPPERKSRALRLDQS
jgi:hypothetical protein